jgi:hypothetical protein
MGRNSAWSRLSLLTPRAREASPGYDFAGNVMHIDAEAVCPKCLGWIGPTDIVRRTAYGPVQHEACPITDASAAAMSAS